MGEDIVKVLGSVTGLSKEDLQQIATGVADNHRRLNACPGHDFRELPSKSPMNKKYACQNCQGQIDAHAHYWYEEGRKHANISR